MSTRHGATDTRYLRPLCAVCAPTRPGLRAPAPRAGCRRELRYRNQVGLGSRRAARDGYSGILALESQRHRCLVIGEDLGTVEPQFREQVRLLNVLGCNRAGTESVTVDDVVALMHSFLRETPCLLSMAQL